MKFRKPVNYNSCCWLSVYDTSIEFNHVHDIYRLTACYFERADIEIKLKKEEKQITQRSKKEQMSSTIRKVSERKGKFGKEGKCSSKEIKLIKSNNVTDASKGALCEL